MTVSYDAVGASGTAKALVRTEGERSITIGHDALGNVLVAGDRNEVRVTLVIAHQRLLSALSADPTKTVENPYRGLDAFREIDAPWFFGRNKLVQRTWVLFQKLQHDPASRILAIVGASGSGKSSLIRAGLLPELARQPMVGLVMWELRSSSVVTLEAEA